jgi:type II restriction/modification system DNA methylase subunit YeeA
MSRTDQLNQLRQAGKVLEEEQRAAYAEAQQARVSDIAGPIPNSDRLWKRSGRAALWEKLTRAQALILASGAAGDAFVFAEAMEAFRRRKDGQ